MTVRKCKKNGRVMWRARVVVNGVERTAFRRRKDDAIEAEVKLRQQAKAEKEEKTQAPTLANFEERFLEFSASPAASRKGANRPGTLREKKSHLNHHLVPRFGDKRLDQITAADVDGFVIDLSVRGLSRSSIGNVIGTLQRILRVAKRWGLIPSVPEISAHKGKPERIERDQFFSVRETEALLDAVDEEFKPLVFVALRTGLRTGELRGLRWTDLRLETGWLHVRRQISKEGEGPPKNGKPRIVELAWDAVETLKALPRRGDLVFPGPDGEPFAINALERAVKEGCRRAMLTCEDGSPKELGGHALRHTWASQCMARNVPTRTIMAYGGWSSLAMLERYAHFAPEDVRGEMDKLAPARKPRLVRTGTKGGTEK